MLNKLYFQPLTYKTLSMEAKEGIPILPILVIFPLPMPPKEIVPHSIGFSLRNIDLSIVMCHKQPLSLYQLKSFPFSYQGYLQQEQYEILVPKSFWVHEH